MVRADSDGRRVMLKCDPEIEAEHYAADVSFPGAPQVQRPSLRLPSDSCIRLKLQISGIWDRAVREITCPVHVVAGLESYHLEGFATFLDESEEICHDGDCKKSGENGDGDGVKMSTGTVRVFRSLARSLRAGTFSAIQGTHFVPFERPAEVALLLAQRLGLSRGQL